MDIGGHPPFPTGSKQFSSNLLFLAIFQVLNFRSRFEALNDVFLGKRGETWNKFQCFSNKSFIPWIDLSNELSCAPNKDRMPKLRPWEVNVSTTPIGAKNLLAFHLPGLGFWIFLMLKRPLEPHCNNHLLEKERNHHISSQR